MCICNQSECKDLTGRPRRKFLKHTFLEHPVDKFSWKFNTYFKPMHTSTFHTKFTTHFIKFPDSPYQVHFGGVPHPRLHCPLLLGHILMPSFCPRWHFYPSHCAGISNNHHHHSASCLHCLHCLLNDILHAKREGEGGRLKRPWLKCRLILIAEWFGTRFQIR